MKTPEEKTKNFIEKQYLLEKDKRDSGMKNNYYAWKDYMSDFEYQKKDSIELKIIKRNLNSLDFKEFLKRKGFTIEEIEDIKKTILEEN